MWSKPGFSLQAEFGNVPCLDGLRAVSVLIVLCSHFISASLFPGGLGVLVFFVISGFLITRLLFAEWRNDGAVHLGNFYARRILRLYPVVIAYSLVVVAVYYANGLKVSWVEPVSSIAYFANYLYSYYSVVGRTGGDMPFGLFWSLSVEEHFYIFFPATFVVLAGRPRLFLAVLAVFAVTALGLRLLVAGQHPDLLGSYVFYYQTQFRADSLMTGVMLAVACELEAGRRACRWLARSDLLFYGAILGILASLALRDPFFRETVRYSLQSVCAAVILVGVAFTDRRWLFRAILESAPARWIGRLSYSLYVWHELVPTSMKAWHLSLPQPLEAGAQFAGAFALATASYYFLEMPVMNLRRRFGSRSRPRPG